MRFIVLSVVWIVWLPVQAGVPVPVPAACPAAGPAETAGTATGTLPEFDFSALWRLASVNNPDLARFEDSRALARAEVLAARQWANPELEISGSRGWSRGAEGPTRFEWSTGFSQPLELPAQRRTRLAAARAGLAIPDSEAAWYRVTLREELARACHTWLYHQQALASAEDLRRRIEELDRQVTARRKAGEASGLEQLKSRQILLQTRQACVEHQANLTACQQALRFLCGDSLPPQFNLAGTFSQPSPPVPPEPDYLSLYSRHPAVQRCQAELHRLELALDHEVSKRRPGLTPGFSAGQELDRNSFAASLRIELPLWNRNQAGIARAGAEIQQARTGLELQKRQVRRTIEQARQLYRQACQLREVSRELSREALESLNMETLRYQEGESDLLTLLECERLYYGLINGYQQSSLETWLALASLESALGTGGEL